MVSDNMSELSYGTADSLVLGNEDTWVYLATSSCITVRNRCDAELIEKIPGTRYTMQHLLSPNGKYLAICTTINSIISVFSIENPHRLCFRVNLKEQPTAHMTFDENGKNLFVGIWDKIYMISIPDGKVTCLVQHKTGTMCVDLSCEKDSLIGAYWGAQSGLGQHLLYLPCVGKSDPILIQVENQQDILMRAFLISNHEFFLNWGGTQHKITRNRFDSHEISDTKAQIHRLDALWMSLSYNKRYFVITSRDAIKSSKADGLHLQTEIFDSTSFESVYTASVSRSGSSSISMSGEYFLLADKKSKVIPMKSIITPSEI